MALEEARASPSPPADLGEAPPGIGSGVSSGIGSGVSAGIGSGVPYHERQRRQLCALHALNSLLQQPWLSQRDADGICRRLAPRSVPNPHRSPLGLGNYDVNVVMAALRQRGLAALWWDRRRSLDLLSLPHILGFLLNVPSQVRVLGSLPLPLRRPHWFSVRRLGGIFYNLDSKLPRAEPIGPEGSLRPFLAAALSQAPSQLFLVVTEDVEETGAWLRAPGTPETPGDTPGDTPGTPGTHLSDLGTPERPERHLSDTPGTAGTHLGHLRDLSDLETAGDTPGTHLGHT